MVDPLQTLCRMVEAWVLNGDERTWMDDGGERTRKITEGMGMCEEAKG